MLSYHILIVLYHKFFKFICFCLEEERLKNGNLGIFLKSNYLFLLFSLFYCMHKWFGLLFFCIAITAYFIPCRYFLKTGYKVGHSLSISFFSLIYLKTNIWIFCILIILPVVITEKNRDSNIINRRNWQNLIYPKYFYNHGLRSLFSQFLLWSAFCLYLYV